MCIYIQSKIEYTFGFLKEREKTKEGDGEVKIEVFLKDYTHRIKCNIPMNTHISVFNGCVGRWDGWSICWSVACLVVLSQVPNRARSYTSMLISEHLFF